MSIKINSMLDTTNNSWEVSLGGELDVSTADELKKLHKLVDRKKYRYRIKSWKFRLYRFNWTWCNYRYIKD